ncbi:MAG: DsbE family thiol:disulfide interchange protein [Pseudomonadota bacterium]
METQKPSGGRRSLSFLPLLFFAALIAIFLSQIDKDPSVLPSARLNKPVPSFALPALDGGKLSEAILSQNQPVLMNVFASWCQPCLLEHGVITKIAETGVPIIGWAYKDKPADIARFLERLGNPYQHVVLDAPGRIAIEFGVYGAPETYVIDCNGIIRQRFVGALTTKVFDGQLRPALDALAADPSSGCDSAPAA